MEETADLETIFVLFSKHGDPKSDGKTITLSQSDKWMKHAKLLDMKTITTTDTGVCFNKFKSRTIDFKNYKKFIEDLAHTKNMNPEDLFGKLTTCGLPETKETPAKGAKFGIKK